MNIKITLSIVGVTELITHAFKHTTMLESLLQPLREHLPQDRIWQTLLTTPCLGGMLMLPLLFSGNATASVRGYLSGPLFVRILNRVPRLSPRGLSLLFAALGILILQFAVGRLLPDLYRGKIDPAIQFALMALFIARFGCFNMPRSQETVTVSEPVRLLPFDDDTCGVILLPEQGRVMLFRTGKMPSLHNGERTVYKRPDERAMGFLCDSSVPLQFRNGIELSRFLEVQLEASLFVTPLKQKIDMKEIGDEPVSYAQLQDSIHQLAQESVAPLLLMHPEVAALNAELVAMNARIAPDQDEMVDLDLPTPDRHTEGTGASPSNRQGRSRWNQSEWNRRWR